MSNRLLLSLLIALTQLGTVQAQGSVLTLRQAVTQALDAHPSLRRATELQLSREQAEQAAATAYEPRLSLEAIAKEGPSGAPFLGVQGLVNSVLTRNYGASLVLSHTLIDSGRRYHRVRTRREAARAAAAEVELTRARVLLGVHRSYYATLLSQHLLEVARQDLVARELTVKLAQNRLAVGLSSRVDFDLARVGQSEAEVRLATARDSVLEARQDLGLALGAQLPDEVALQEPSPGDEDTPTTAQGLELRPEWQILSHRIDTSREDAEAARAEGGPTLRAFLSGGYINVPQLNADQNSNYAVGLTLTVPLFTAGEEEARAQELEHQAAATEAERAELEQQIQAEILKARLRLARALGIRASTEQQLTYARDGARLAAMRYEFGLGNLLEAQQAQLAVVNAQTEWHRNEYLILTARAEYLFALGLLKDSR